MNNDRCSTVPLVPGTRAWVSPSSLGFPGSDYGAGLRGAGWAALQSNLPGINTLNYNAS